MTLKRIINNAQKMVIEQELKLNDYNIAAAARALDIPRPTLVFKIKKLGIIMPEHSMSFKRSKHGK